MARKTILIVEDDPYICSSLKEFFEENEYQVFVALNGLEALNILKTSITPSLILLDLMMPVMDGFQFRENQLADQNLKHIPVVVMSADGNLGEKNAKTTAHEYIKKPFDIFNLLTIVEKIILEPT